MALRFDNVRKSRPKLLPRTPVYRLVSMCLALLLVMGLIARLQSREAQNLLAMFFGGEPMAAPADKIASGDDRAPSDLAHSESEDPEPVVTVGIDPAKLEGITDNTYFRNNETTAWFHLLEAAQKTPQSDLARQSVAEVVYAQLSRQPNAYRGRVVTVRGTVERIETVVPVKNDLGFTSLYRLVVRPAGRDLLPVFVYTLSLPDGFEGGKIPKHEASFAGYFFKNLSYSSPGGVNVAPVIVANSFTAKIKTPPPPPATAEMPVWQILLMALAIAGIFVLWAWQRPAGRMSAAPVEGKFELPKSGEDPERDEKSEGSEETDES